MVKRYHALPMVISLVTLLLCTEIILGQGTTEFVSYPCRHKSASQIVALLRPLLAQSETELVIDQEQNRLLVAGPESSHELVRRVLSEVDRKPTATAAKSGDRQFVRVPIDQVDRVRQQFLAIFPKQLQVVRDGSREIYRLRTERPEVGPLEAEIEFDTTRGIVLISGDGQLGDQLVRLFSSLGNKPTGPTRAQVLRLRRDNHVRVQGIIDKSSALPARTEMSHQASAIPTSTERGLIRLPDTESDEAELVASRTADNGVVWAGFLFQPEAVGDGQAIGPSGGSGPRDADATQDNDNEQTPTDSTNIPNVRQFEGVEVESLPDLDVIIIRGSDQDLEQLADIVAQLERISQETQPEIRIYPLQHTSSEAVADLIEQISQDLVGGRQGKVSVTPLVKPNALLLIGWGESVASMLQLIEQLDQPVSPDSQSAVFHLKYSSVADIQTTLQGFFANRKGLGPRIQIAVEPRTNAIVVYAAPRDMVEISRLIKELDQPSGEAVNRAVIFRIENALATDVANTLQQAIQAASGPGSRVASLELQTFDPQGQQLLRSGVLRDVKITPNPRNNTILVSSLPENLEVIAELIRQLDTPAGQAKIKVFRIVNSDASGLVVTLRSLIPASAGGDLGPQLSSAPGESNLTPLRFSVDTRSNSILATGSEGDLRIVEALLAKLDQATSQQRKTTVYRLKNSPAVDVASAVNQYLVSRRQIENAAPGQDSPFQDIEREVVVVPEPIANKLILAATPRYFEEISRLIEKLDEQPPQVMIQVLIAEVALNNADEFGVELGLQDSVLFDRSLLGDLVTTTNTSQNSTPAGVVTSTEELIRAATNIPGFAFNSLQPLGNSGSQAALAGSKKVGGQAISNFSVGRSNETSGFGGLVLSASSKNVSVLLRALQESRRVDVLSRPQIRTLDNQPAFIQVGQRVPRIVGSTVNQNGQSNSVSLENVGLILGVTPRVSPDGTVVMEIDAEKSSLGPEADGIPVAVSIDGTVVRSPRVDTTTAQATVSAADGETIVLGGLITEGDQYVYRSVPFLGEIPILNRLFRYDSHTKKRSELLIILTPQVIRSAADNERVRQAEMGRMSWCAADIFRMQGEIGFYDQPEVGQIGVGEPEVVFPDLNPTGTNDAIMPPIPEEQFEGPANSEPTP